MILLLSGEGPTDLGICDIAVEQCSNDTSGHFSCGVLTYIIDSIFYSNMNYYLKDTPDSIHYIHKSYLVERSKSSSGGRKMMSMRGVKKAAETGYFFSNAKALGTIALELKNEKDCPVIAVLFRDSDGTHNAPTNDWQIKYDSMIQGFNASNCETGVPMLAKPKSEAWLLAACKDNPYQHCNLLEEASGNDTSVNSLKDQLAEKIGSHCAPALIDWISCISYDYETVAQQMPSFNMFYQRFLSVLNKLKKDFKTC